MEREGIFKLGGKGVTIIGPDIKIGQAAPDFKVQDQDWNEINVLATSAGKVRILASVPSLSTSVCDRETRRFNEEAAGLGEDIRVFTISHDLPFTQKNWCGAAGVERVAVLSDHKDADFGEKYGTLIKERRILRRAVFVVDKEGMVTYSDYMAELGDEPDYEAVLTAAREAANH